NLSLSRNRHRLTSPHRLRDLASEIAKNCKDHAVVLGYSDRRRPSYVLVPYCLTGSTQPIGFHRRRTGGDDFDFELVPVWAKGAAIRLNRRHFRFRTAPHYELPF